MDVNLRLEAPEYKHAWGPPSRSQGLLKRTAYARVTLISSGVRTPWACLTTDEEEEPVLFMLELEPLVAGVLPSSILSILGFLVIAVIATLFFTSPVYHRLVVLADWRPISNGPVSKDDWKSL
jgi:hypothetical protein